MRSCATCEMLVCFYCLPDDRANCMRCPEVNSSYRENNDLGSRCQKCSWTYYEANRHWERGMQRCPYCKLAICEWCCSLDQQRCARLCPAKRPVRVRRRVDTPALTEGRSRRLAWELPQVRHVALDLSARARSTTSVTAMDRLRAAILRDRPRVHGG